MVFAYHLLLLKKTTTVEDIVYIALETSSNVVELQQKVDEFNPTRLLNLKKLIYKIVNNLF